MKGLDQEVRRGSRGAAGRPGRPAWSCAQEPTPAATRACLQEQGTFRTLLARGIKSRCHMAEEGQTQMSLTNDSLCAGIASQLACCCVALRASSCCARLSASLASQRAACATSCDSWISLHPNTRGALVGRVQGQGGCQCTSCRPARPVAAPGAAHQAKSTWHAAHAACCILSNRLA